MAKPIDITGQKFGKLTALKYTGKSEKHKGRIWLCLCECGNTREVSIAALKNKSRYTKECLECVKKSRKAGVNRMKATRRERLYRCWMNMRQRCSNPNASHFSCYGGRGIRVCDEWNDSYQAFKEWAIANGYKDDLTIERIDINKGYCPENCKWITQKEQGYNKRDTLFIEFEGKKISVSKFVFDLGLSYNAITHYLRTYK